jgi:hypothetical protein
MTVFAVPDTAGKQRLAVTARLAELACFLHCFEALRCAGGGGVLLKRTD